MTILNILNHLISDLFLILPCPNSFSQIKNTDVSEQLDDLD